MYIILYIYIVHTNLPLHMLHALHASQALHALYCMHNLHCIHHTHSMRYMHYNHYTHCVHVICIIEARGHWNRLICIGFALGAHLMPVGFPLGAHWICVGFAFCVHSVCVRFTFSCHWICVAFAFDVHGASVQCPSSSIACPLGRAFGFNWICMLVGMWICNGFALALHWICLAPSTLLPYSCCSTDSRTTPFYMRFLHFCPYCLPHSPAC